MTMFQFARSTVARVSRSFPDLLNFWSTRERSENRHKSQSLTHLAPVPNRHTDSQLKATNSEHISDEQSSQKDDASKLLTDNITCLATASFYSSERSNGNIEFLKRNDNTVSTESIGSVKYRETDHLYPSDGIGKETSPFDGQAFEPESRMDGKCKNNAHENEMFCTENVCREKQIHVGAEAHASLRRSRRLSRPRCESRIESNLLSKPKKKMAIAQRGQEPLDVSTISQWSRSSTYKDDGDDYLTVTGWNQRRLCLPSTDSHQKIVHIEKSSHIIVNTSTSAGPPASSSAEGNPFTSLPSKGSTSIPSGDSIAHSIRNTVAELTHSILNEHKKSNTSVETKRLKEARRRLIDENRDFAYLKCRKAILIFSLHIEFKKESICKQFCDFYQDSILNISEPVLQLDFKQMKDILRKNVESESDTLKLKICRSKSEEIIEGAECKPHQAVYLSEQTMTSISKTALPSGFPREVAKFLKNVDNIRKGEEFFQCPADELYTEIDSFRTSANEEDHAKYLALIAVFVYGFLDFAIFDQHSLYQAKSVKDLKSYIASHYVKDQRCAQKIRPPEMVYVLHGFSKRFCLNANLAGSVKRGVKQLLGRFIKEQSNGLYAFASISVEKVVAISCAQEYPVEVCSFSSWTVFNSVIGPDEVFEEKDTHVSVNEKDSRLLLEIIKRLRKLLSTNKILEFIEHPALRAPWFAKQFIKHMKRKKHGLKNIFLSSDSKSGRSALSLSLELPYKSAAVTSSQCFAEDLIMTRKWQKFRKCKHDFASGIEQELLEKSCEMQWESSFLRLTDKFQMYPSKRCLSLAVNSGSNIIIEDLLTRQPALTEDNWYMALRQAFEKFTKNDAVTLQVILTLKGKVHLEYSSDSVESIIYSASRQGDDHLLSKVITFYREKNVKNKEGKTCIHLATEAHHCHCVRTALRNGVSQLIRDSRGEMPIHYAC